MSGRMDDLRHHPVTRVLRRLGARLGLWALAHFVDDAVRSLWRARASSAFAITIIGLSLATVGAFLLITQNLAGLSQRLGSLEVSVYLASDTTDAGAIALAEQVRSIDGVTAVRYVSRDEAMQTLRELQPQMAAIADALGDNPLPASLELRLTRAAREPEAITALSDRLRQLESVAVVDHDLKLAERFVAARRVFQLVATSLGGVLLLAALFTVAVVVKLTVAARQHEIEILRIVGATRAYVRGTFVAEGIIQGLSGAIVALVLLSILHLVASAWLGATGPPVLASLTTEFLAARSLLLLVATGAALGAAGSLASVGRGV